MKDFERISTEIQQLGIRVTTRTADRIAYSRDWSPRYKEELILPDIVVVPKSTDEVAAVVKLAYNYDVPVTPFAGGTGMGGGVICHYGGILIETKGLNTIFEIDTANLTISCGTGITIAKLNEELAKHNLWMPHQPESKLASTVGAAISCDNDSTFGIRYGKMSDTLLDAKMVTGTGDIIRVGHRKALCSSTGYKLAQLIIGAEGTLGIVTEATLRIFHLPHQRKLKGYVFRELQQGINALERLLNSGLCVESGNLNCKKRMEFYTHAYREKYGKPPEIPHWAEALLFISFAGDTDVVEFSLNKANDILLHEFNAGLVAEEEIVNDWWASKHTLEFKPFHQKWPDSQRQKKFGAADVGLPFGKIEEGYRRYLSLSQKYNLDILGMNVYNERANKVSPSISFAVFVDDSKHQSVDNFYKYVKEMSIMAVELEGTMSTYIGDGDRLGGFNVLEHGDAYEYMKKIKQLFDPKSILNRGKKFESKWNLHP